MSKVTMQAWLADYYDAGLFLQDTPENRANKVLFYREGSKPTGHTHVGTAEIDLHVFGEETLRQAAIESLQRTIQEERAAFAIKVQKLEEKLRDLQCLPAPGEVVSRDF